MARMTIGFGFYLVLMFAIPICAEGQTATYHLHGEWTTTTAVARQLKTAGPDSAIFSEASINLKNVPVGEYSVGSWETQPGVPNASGVIPAGSTVTFNLWMRKTGNSGTMYPRAKIFLAGDLANSICIGTGTTALTTTLTQYTFTGTIGSPVTMTSTDRFYLRVAVNLTAGTNNNLMAEAAVEGTLNGNYDSHITLPLPTTPPPSPAITNLSPSSGPIGSAVTINGTNFGAPQGGSSVTFNGVTAAPSSWNATSIVAPVPVGAMTGPVVVTVSGVASNGVTFTVVTTGLIAGTVTSAAGGSPITGALVEALQSGVVNATATTGAGGTYTLSGIIAGDYDVRASAPDYITQSQTGVTVTTGATTTANFSLPVDASIRYIYDAIGRLVGVVDPLADAATYNYDAVGNLLSISRYNSTAISIIEFTPNQGLVGATVTIYGTGFSTVPGENTVRFNGVIAPVVSATSTQIVTSVPSGASSGAISITTPGGSTTSSSVFTVMSSGGTPTVSGFTPTTGTPGTSVTITGTNFETTSSTNRVRFNLMHASPSSSSTTSISTPVPSSATSGRITVTTPAGQGVSSEDFFVPPAPYTATDLAFTDRMSFGGTLTVTFSTAGKIGLVVFDGLAGRRLSLNITGVTITESNVSIKKPDGATLASVSATVNSGGFIDQTVMPVSGTYTILIDPSSSHTGSMTLSLYDVVDLPSGVVVVDGSPVSLAFTTPGQNAQLTFSGNAGSRLSLQASDVTTAFGSIQIFNPDGSLASNGTFSSTPGSSIVNFLDFLLTNSGTYTVLIDPNGSSTGSLNLTLRTVPADATGTITVGGPPVTTPITAGGQRANLTFAGTAGQRVSTRTTSAAPLEIWLAIIKPDGSGLAGSATYWTGFLDAVVLPVTGTYTLALDPLGSFTGNLTTTLYNVPADLTNPITPGGAAVVQSVTTPGQNARLTFNGTADQRISISLNNSFPDFWFDSGLRRELRGPDNQLLNSSAVNNGSSFIEPITLPLTGAYTIDYNPTEYNTGSITTTLYSVPPDVTGALTINGSLINVSLTSPGQNATLTFSGTSGQQVTVKLSGNNIDAVTVSLRSVSGSTLTSSTSSNNNFNLATQTLPVTGTYSVVINPPGTNTGSIKVKVTSP